MRNRIREIIQKEKKKLLKKEGVVSIGSGFKIIDGALTDLPCITVSVEEKLIPKMVKKKNLVPLTIDSVLTDVVESKIIKALHTQKHRPVPGGVSGGHREATGTLGGLTTQGVETYILSNNHVLSLSNEAELGDPIIQPGGADGGEYPRDHVADLADFVPINMGGMASDCPFACAIKAVLNGLFKLVGSHTIFRIIRTQEGDNLVDAAIAKPLNPDIVSSEIFKIGEVKGIVNAEVGMEIQGSSRTSGLRFGTIDQVDVVVKVQYGGGKVAVFEDQLISNTMQAKGGDSLSGDMRLYWKSNSVLQFGSLVDLHKEFESGCDIEVLSLKHKKKHHSNAAVPSIETGCVDWAKVDGSFYHGIKPVYLVTLRDGKQIEITKDHSLFTSNNGITSSLMSKSLFQLETCIGVTKEIEGSSVGIDNILLTFLGLWLADGCWIKKNKGKKAAGVSIATGNDEVIKDFILSFESSFKYKDKGDYRFHSVKFAQQMIDLGFNLDWTSHSKRIPKWLFVASKREICSFLKGYFSGDGWAQVGGTGGRRLVACGSVSRKLLEDIQFLLSRLGIQGSIDSGGFNHTYSLLRQYKLRIERANSVNSFMEKIGFLHDIKLSKPVVRTERELAIRGIRSIESMWEKPVYDLSVKPSESFVAQGVLCHNSGTFVLSKEGYLTGLLFAGSENTLVANRIQNVVTELNLQF